MMFLKPEGKQSLSKETWWNVGKSPMESLEVKNIIGRNESWLGKAQEKDKCWFVNWPTDVHSASLSPFPGPALGQKELKSPRTMPLGGLGMQGQRPSEGQRRRDAPALGARRASEALLTRAQPLSCPSPTTPDCPVLAQSMAAHWPQHRLPFQAVSTISHTVTNSTCVHPELLWVYISSTVLQAADGLWASSAFRTSLFHLHCICAKRCRLSVPLENRKPRNCRKSCCVQRTPSASAWWCR